MKNFVLTFLVGALVVFGGFSVAWGKTINCIAYQRSANAFENTEQMEKFFPRKMVLFASDARDKLASAQAIFSSKGITKYGPVEIKVNLLPNGKAIANGSGKFTEAGSGSRNLGNSLQASLAIARYKCDMTSKEVFAYIASNTSETKTEVIKDVQSDNSIINDIYSPTISARIFPEDEVNTLIKGVVTDNVGVAELSIAGQQVNLGEDGSFGKSFFVPRDGLIVEIVAFDTSGNKASSSIRLIRQNVQQTATPSFDSLNPSGKRVVRNKNALALIVGVSDYTQTTAKAQYADNDARMFYDYAMLKLGLSPSQITELVNDGAGEVDILKATKSWLSRSVKQGDTDVYVFFAGHGLASDDGKQMYLLPYDGSPELLEKTAILREELFNDISSSNPRSVTVFLDTCYSGTTRGTDMLIASRPIALKALKQSLPDNFTVLTAAAGDQTAKPLEEAKHGMFSYFLMKGMEGDADTNQDNKITAGELHAYVQENVVQQSSGSQTPELQGDADRVLVQFQ